MGIRFPTATKPSNRPPAVAGLFYPSDPTELRRIVRTFIDAAEAPALSHVRAVIVPHAGYQFSGPVAGFGYKAMATLPDAEYTLYLMGPTHWLPVNGVGLAGVDTFETPLGRVPVATQEVAGWLKQGEPYHVVDVAHGPEHCLEVQLPFLQVVLRRFEIVPMLLDSEADPERVGTDLVREIAADPHTLIVVSSDLSHYYPYDEAVCLDRAFLADVAAGNKEAAAQGEACGLIPILCLMEVAGVMGWTAHVLDYRNSGDTGGSRWNVVGYGAVAYTQ